MSVELLSFRNWSPSDPARANLFLAAATGEPRGWNLLETIAANIPVRWHLLEPSARHTVEDIKKLMLSRSVETHGVDLSVLGDQLRLMASAKSGHIHVMLDVSCMSRTVMAEVFQHVFSLASGMKMTVTVVYALAEFTMPPEHMPPNEDIRPVSAYFAGWPSTSSASTTLIVGLGYEKDKADGACEYFDPSETWVFNPKSPIEEYDQQVSANNKELLARAARSEREVEYSVDDPEKTFGELVTVVSSLLSRSNPLILPFGPKIFFAISLLVSLLYREIGVWLVTGDLEGTAIDHKGSNHVTGFRFEIAPVRVDSEESAT